MSKKRPYSDNFSKDSAKINLDMQYRILADHIRMITISLSDGVLPHDR